MQQKIIRPAIARMMMKAAAAMPAIKPTVTWKPEDLELAAAVEGAEEESERADVVLDFPVAVVKAAAVDSHPVTRESAT